MIWFTPEHPRDVKLRSAVLLVSKNKSKRIKMFCSITIKNESGDPDWLEEAATFVMQHGHEVNIPEIKIVGQNITMGDDNLFKKRVEAPKSEIRSFKCKQCGDSEEPDTELQFVIYCTFSTDIWKWCGQMGGQEFYMKFEGATPEPGDVVVSNQLELTSPEPKQEPEKEEGDDIDPDEDLTGPEHDAAFGAVQAKPAKESQSSKAAKAAAAAKAVDQKASGKKLHVLM